MINLIDKKILYIICGGISAYKSLETIRLFKKKGAQIKTILTKSAKEFITPLSVASLSQGKVYSDLFNVENETEMDHIALSRWADVILIAPATANTISKLAQGTTDDLASTVVLASNKENYLDGKVQIMAIIDMNGNLLNSKILISSGNKLIDEMAIHILEQSAPFAPFDTDMSNQYSVLEIVRDWNFSSD